MRRMMPDGDRPRDVRRVLNQIGAYGLQRGRDRRLLPGSPPPSSARLARQRGPERRRRPRSAEHRSGQHDLAVRVPADAGEREHARARSTRASRTSARPTTTPASSRPRRAHERGRRAGQGGRAAVLLPQPQLRVREQAGGRLAALRHPARGDRPRAGEVRARPVLDHPRRAPTRSSTSATHPSRYFAYHVKDRTWGDRPDENDWEDVGPGSIDFPDIFAAGLGRPRTDKHYFVEHDAPSLSHPDDPKAEFKTAQAGVDVPEERQVLGLPGPAGPTATGGPGRSRSSGPSPRSPSRPSGGRGAGRR